MQNPVTGPTAFESFQNINPIWQALNTAFLTVAGNTSAVTSTNLYYYQKIYGPLFEMFQQFPNGQLCMCVMLWLPRGSKIMCVLFWSALMTLLPL